MGRRSIDDDLILMDMAMAIVRCPDISFAQAFRQVHRNLQGEIRGNSTDSTRRRLLRKFKKDRYLWLERAENKIAERRAQAWREMYEQFWKHAEHVNQVMDILKPVVDRRVHEVTLALESLQPALRQAALVHDAFQQRSAEALGVVEKAISQANVSFSYPKNLKRRM